MNDIKFGKVYKSVFTGIQKYVVPIRLESDRRRMLVSSIKDGNEFLQHTEYFKAHYTLYEKPNVQN